MDPFWLLNDGTLIYMKSSNYFGPSLTDNKTKEAEGLENESREAKLTKPIQVEFFNKHSIYIRFVRPSDNGSIYFITTENELICCYDPSISYSFFCTEQMSIHKNLYKPNPKFLSPNKPVKEFFIHHSTTENEKIFFQTDDSFYFYDCGDTVHEVKELIGKTVVKYCISDAVAIFLCRDGLYYRQLSDVCYLVYETNSTAEGKGFVNLEFFKDKHPTQVHCGTTYIYILCDDGLYGYGYDCDVSLETPKNDSDKDDGDTQGEPSPKLVSENEDDENEDEEDEQFPKLPKKIKLFEDKNILKITGNSKHVLCLCEDGLYTWACFNGEDNEGGYYLGDTRYEKGAFRMEFFDDKNIHDVYINENGVCWVLCKEGLYSWGIEGNCCDIFEDKNLPDPIETPQLASYFSNQYPVVFDRHITNSRLNMKRALPVGTEDDEEPALKQAKTDDSFC